MATDTTPQPAKNLTTSQVPDAVAVYLAAARERWNAAGSGRWHDYATALELLSSALRSAGDVPRLLGAVEIALKQHQDDSYGRCVTCLEHCNCVGDAYGPLIGKGLPASEVHRIVCEAWENCTHGNEPWPCKPYRDITAGLLRAKETAGD